MNNISPDTLITFAIFGVSAILFVSNRLRSDLIGVLVILALSLSGVLTPDEALAGFSNPVLIILVCMFVVGEAVSNTGIAQRLAKKVADVGHGSEALLITLLMVAAGFLGAFMNSTATVAIFIPLAVSVCNEADLNRKRLLIPISIAALVSGMMTLVASTQNLISNQLVISYNLEPIDFFEFTPFGLCILSAAILYTLFFGRRLLGPQECSETPNRGMRTSDLIKKYDLHDKMRRYQIQPGSSLIGLNVFQARLRENFDLDLLAVEKTRLRGRQFIKPCVETPFQEGDILLLVGEVEDLKTAAEKKKLQACSRLHGEVRQAMLQEIGAAEILIGPDSSLIGQTLKQIQFRRRYDVTVISVRRGGKTDRDLKTDHRLRFGDTLLVCGAWTDILNLMDERVNFVLLNMPRESCEVLPARHKAPLVVAILTTMILCMAFEVLPTVLIAMLVGLSLMLTGCVNLKKIYRKISWQSIILIGGMLPMATALDKSGASDAISANWTALVHAWPPIAILFALFFLTAAVGLFLPASATAVLIIPIAIEAALDIGMPPHAMIMTTTIACACPFISPYSAPANLLAMETGGYELKDFIRIGTPLLFMAATITVFLVQYLYL
tara:strand:+ start:7167 stop:8999 length:1833 start_codon:yes stop_codon:yes gene_type:complete